MGRVRPFPFSRAGVKDPCRPQPSRRGRTTEKVTYDVAQCLNSQMQDYLPELCAPVAQVAERQHLRSASRRLLVVPGIQLDMYGRRAFAVVGPTVWNALSNDLRDPDLSIAIFGRLLKTHLFQQYSVHRAH